MTRLVTLGGEVQPSSTTGSPNPEYPGGATGTVAVSATTPRTGAGCIRCTDNTGSQASFITLKAGPAVAASATIYARIYAMIPGSGFFPVSSAQLLALQAVVSARITSAGTLQLWNETGTPAQIGSSSAALTPATYYRVELKLTANASSQITTVELRLNGATVASASGLTLAVGSAALNAGWVTTPGGVKVVSLDDIAVNDGAGTANNSWPGDGAVVMLFPTADSAVGTGWTLGTGTAIASNGFDAVNNVTPQGLADLQASSDPKQIRNAASAANSNYDATMTTYTTAGVPAGATINAVVPWTATAAPVTTSAKAGTVGVVSNPAITNVALSAAGTAGAFWQGVAAGIWPTGWKWSSGTITEAPTVTLGTAPVMRVTQVTASTRIAMVCFMGIYVDYTPSSVTTWNSSSAAALIDAIVTAGIRETFSTSAAGLVDAIVTAAVRDTFSLVTVPLLVGVTTNGQVVALVSGVSAVTETATVTTNGTRERLGSTATSETVGVVTSATVAATAAAAVTQAAAVTTSGLVTANAAATVQLTDTVTTSGTAGTGAQTYFGATTVALTATATTAGVRDTTGSSTVALTDAVTTLGTRTLVTASTAASVATVTTTGTRETFSASATAETVLIVSSSGAGSTGAATVNLTGTITTAGTRVAVTSSTASLAVNVTTAATVTAGASATAALTDTVTTAGSRSTFSTSTVPLTVAVTTLGAKVKFGDVTVTEHVTVTTGGYRDVLATSTSELHVQIVADSDVIVPLPPGRIDTITIGGITHTIWRGIDGTQQGELSTSNDGALAKAGAA